MLTYRLSPAEEGGGGPMSVEKTDPTKAELEQAADGAQKTAQIAILTLQFLDAQSIAACSAKDMYVCQTWLREVAKTSETQLEELRFKLKASRG